MPRAHNIGLAAWKFEIENREIIKSDNNMWLITLSSFYCTLNAVSKICPCDSFLNLYDRRCQKSSEKVVKTSEMYHW